MVPSTYTGKTRQVAVIIDGPIVQSFAKLSGVRQMLSFNQVFDVPVEQGRFEEFMAQLERSSLAQFYCNKGRGEIKVQDSKVVLATDNRDHYNMMCGHLIDFGMDYAVGNLPKVAS